jgi:phosphohistidine swiveling domain-containing protein
VISGSKRGHSEGGIRGQAVGFTDMQLMRSLDDAGVDDGAQLGGKASTLAELKRAGFPVPEGVVVTTRALAQALASAGVGADVRSEDVEAIALPADLAAELSAAIEQLGPGPFAVRSSGVDEDLPGASYAGLYETVLNVAAEDVPDAVRHCWASAFSQRVEAYRQSSGSDGQVAMAVLILPMVQADAAGVAFSADPISGDRGTALVNAVRGLGERLVSGNASPDEWVVRGGDASRRAAPEGAIDAATATRVAELARRVERQRGAPQDIEWALAGNDLVLLQARPITGLPDQPVEPMPVPVEVPPGFWEREASHAPKPWTPMSLSAGMDQPRNQAIRRMFGEYGILAETLEFAQIGGWDYSRLVPLGGKDRPAPPAFLMPLLIRLVPVMRHRIADAVVTIRTNKAGRLVEQWYDEWHPELDARIAALREVDLEDLNYQKLDAETGRAAELLRRGIEIHFALHGALMPILAELAFTCQEQLGWSDQEFLELLAGLSSTSTQPAHRLAELARLAAERPAVCELLAHVDRRTSDRLATADPEFAEAFTGYQRDFSIRALRYEIADPSLAETPELTLRLLADQLVHGYDPEEEADALAERRKAAVNRARAALSSHPRAERERFERALSQAERAYPVREDNEFFTVSVPVALLRYRLLELGRRLLAREQFVRSDDVFFLTLDEARAALRNGEDQRELVTRRRGERAFIEQHPGPPTYGKPPGPPPSLDALPPEAKFLMQGLAWYIDRVFEATSGNREQRPDGDVLDGIAASAGRYTGPVRVIMDESNFGRLRSGDVLVCPITSPVWSVLFPSVGALVTDTGGVLSHPAIIAREYRVPAVVATGNATALLRDDQIVTVDGTVGRIEVGP